MNCNLCFLFHFYGAFSQRAQQYPAEQCRTTRTTNTCCQLTNSALLNNPLAHHQRESHHTLTQQHPSSCALLFIADFTRADLIRVEKKRPQAALEGRIWFFTKLIPIFSS